MLSQTLSTKCRGVDDVMTVQKLQVVIYLALAPYKTIRKLNLTKQRPSTLLDLLTVIDVFSGSFRHFLTFFRLKITKLSDLKLQSLNL